MSAPTTSSPGGLKKLVVAPILVLAALGFATAMSSCTSDSDTDRSAGSLATRTTATAPPTQRAGETHDFVIPEGTSKIVEKGDDPGIIPKQLDVHVGDQIRVRNDDIEIARLGIFDVGAGETMTMTFNEVNVLSGIIFAQGAEGCGAPTPEKKKFIINVRP